MAITAITGTTNFEVELSETVGGVTTTTKEVVNADFEVQSTSTVEKDANGVVLASTTSTITAVAGGKTQEVIEKTEKRIEKDANGNDVEVDFVLAQTLVLDADGKIESGTKTIDGFTQTLGAEGVVTAEAADTSVLGTAISGTALAAAVDIYTAIDGADLAADATIYATEEKVGDDATVKTLFDSNGKEVGSEDTFSQTWDGVTYTTTNHKDKDGEYIGSSGGDGTNSWSNFQVESTVDGVAVITETGSDNWNGEARTWTYVFNAATGDLISGSEVFDGITTTFGANWAIAGESVDLSGLTDTMTAEQVENTPDAIVTKFSLTTDTLVKKEAFDFYGEGTVAEEYTIFDTNGATLGYANVWADDYGTNVSFHDANDVYLGNYWSDAEGRSGESAYVTNSNGTTTESGKYSDGVDGGESSSYEWNFDASGNMTGGEEVRGTTTYTYGANWTLTGTEADVSGLTAVDLDALVAGNSALNDLVKDAFFTDGQTYYSTLEEFSWGGSLLTYLNADGSIRGYADTYSDDWNGDGTVDSTGTTYMDANWNYVGSAWSDSYGSGQQFTTNKAADGSDLSEGQREFGVHTWKDQDGNEETREFDYTYDANWNLVSGVETSSDGVETTYGANWEILGQKADVSGLGGALSDSELTGVPASIQSALTDGNTYASSQTYDWGTDTTYYDSAGTILGYSNSSEWSYGDEQGTNKGFHDAEWNWLGGSWEDKDADGTVIRSGYNSTTEILNSAGAVTGYVDKGGFTEGDFSETYEWTFDANWNMVSGTETRGTTTFTYGANWTLEGSEADTSSLATLDLSTLPDSVVTALFGSDTAVIKFSEETFAWDAGSTQTTYYNSDGAIVGYKDNWSDDWDGDGNADATGSSYMDANWEHIGSSWDDEWGSGFNFTVRTTVDGVVTEINEVGEHSWVGYDGATETREFAFKYDGNWNLISGTEKSSNGETVTFGANWEVTSVSREIDLTSAAMAELTSDDLDDIPSALHAASGATYAETVDNPWGTQTTYLDSAGKILGYSDAYSDDWDGDGEIDSSGTSFQDADWNHLGSTFEDNWSKGFHHTVEIVNVAGDVTGYLEKGSRTDKADGDDAGEYTGETTTTEFTFDTNWNLVSGTETRGSTTTEFGANWTIISQSTNVTDLSTVDVSGLPASVKTLLFSSEGDLTAVKAETTNFEWGGSQTTYYDANGLVLGYSDTYSDDWDGDEVIDSYGTSYMDGDWNHIGGSYNDAYGSGSNFTVVDANTGNRTESGTSTWKTGELDANNVEITETRTFEYEYDSNWNLISGTETTSDGTTIEYGANWEITSSTVSVTGMTALTTLELEGLPTPLKAASGDTFAKVSDWGQTTYFDAGGNILGYYDSWSDGDYSGESYMDANWNHLGGKSSGPDGSSESVRVESFDTNGVFTGAVETGNSSWTYNDGVNTVTETSSYVFNFNAAGEMTGGSEVRPDGTTVKLGANWTFLGEEISVDGLPALTQAEYDALPDALKGDSAATTLYKDPPSGGSMTQGGHGDGGSSERTFIKADGTVLGYSNSYSGDWGSGIDYMDANWNWLGGSGQDDWQKWSMVSEDIMNGSTKTGIQETRTETQKAPGDGANDYTGEARVTVSKYDTNYNFLGMVETITLENGDKIEFEFNENWEIVGEYSLGEGGARTVTDPYQLFQLGEFKIDDAYMEAFAATRGITNFIDGDGDGEADVFTDDYDGDGVSDLVADFGRTMLDSTIFAPAAVKLLTKDSSGDLTGLEITANGYKFKMMGDLSYAGPDAATKTAIDAALADYDESINGQDIFNGLTAEQESLLDDRGYLHDDLKLMDSTDPMFGLDMDRVSGDITSVFVYDTTNNNKPVANATTLEINFADLGAFFMHSDGTPGQGQPGYGAMSLKDMLGGDLSGLSQVEGPALGGMEFVADDGSLVVEFEDEVTGTKTTEVTRDTFDTGGAQLGTVTTRTVTENDGSVTVTRLDFDLATGFTTETDLGSGSRQEGEYAVTEVVTLAGVGQVETVDYAMMGVETEKTTSDSGVVTEVRFNAAGEKITSVTNPDKSGTLTELSADGNTEWVTTVASDYTVTLHRMTKTTDGTFVQDTSPGNTGTGTATFNGDISASMDITWGDGFSSTSSIDYVTNTEMWSYYDNDGKLDSTHVYTTSEDGALNRVSTYDDGTVEKNEFRVLDDGALSRTIKDENDEVFKVSVTSYDADNTETQVVSYLDDNATTVSTYVDDVRMERIKTYNADDGTGNKKGDVVTYSFNPEDLETTQIITDFDGTAKVFVIDSAADGTPDFDTSVQLGRGTHSTSDGTLTIDLALEAGGRLTRATDESGKEIITEYDSSNNLLNIEEIYVENDGSMVTRQTVGTVRTEEIVNEDGSKTVRVVDSASGAISETTVDTQGVSTVKAATGTIDAAANTVTFDVTAGSNTVTTSINLTTGAEVAVVKDSGGAVLSTTTTTEDAAGNEVILEVLADGASTETVINEKGDSQVTAITADNIVTVSEIAKLADGSTATKVLGSGTVAEVNGNSVLTLELADGTSLTESTNISSGAVSATVEDEFGNVRTEDASGNVTFVDDDGVAIEGNEFKSEIDLDYDGAGFDDEYHAGEEYVFDFSSGSYGGGEDHDMNQNHEGAGGSGGSTGSSGSSVSTGSTGGSMQGGTAYSGINAVRPEYNWDDDIPMLSDFA